MNTLMIITAITVYAGAALLTGLILFQHVIYYPGRIRTAIVSAIVSSILWPIFWAGLIVYALIRTFKEWRSIRKFLNKLK